MRRETALKRGAGQVRSESRLRRNADDSDGFSLDRLVGDEPTPDLVLMLDEQYQRLFGLLCDDQLRQIVQYRIEGLSVSEIANDLRLSTRSIERILQRIRGLWSLELGI